jgi:hypothetical protein
MLEKKGWWRLGSTKATVLSGLILMFAPIVVSFSAFLVFPRPMTAHAATLGNIDQYEAGDNVTSPIWGGASLSACAMTNAGRPRFAMPPKNS